MDFNSIIFSVSGSDESKPEPTYSENTSIYEDIIPETCLTPKTEGMIIIRI